MKPNYFLKKAPFVRLILPVIIGISLAFWFNQWHWFVFAFIALSLIITGVYWFLLKSQRKFQYDVVFGFFLLLQLASLSYTVAYFSFDKNRENYLGDIDSSSYCFQIKNQPVLKGQYFKCVGTALCAWDTSWVGVQGNVLLFIELSETLPQYGDILTVESKIEEISPPKNPQDFNYKRFLKYKNINYQGFVRIGKWSLVKRDQGSKLMKKVHSVAHNVEDRLFTFIQNDADRGIVAALILGNKSWLDPELLGDFSNTGTMHILAVSGLHVGIIYLLLTSVLAKLFPRSWSVIKLIILLLLLWLFALLTGFSPSVSRACFMLSVVAIGESFQRKVSVYNTLAFSAFCLLLWNPKNLMQVGFQFSYLAVLGIVTLQKPLRNLFSTSSWLVDKILSLAAVSCAAQIATLPLALFYFGQFPVYFLVSNLIVVPLVAIVVYGCICLLIISWWTVLAKLVASLITAYLWFMRSTVDVVSNLPHSLIDSIHISFFEMCGIIILILFISDFLIRKKIRSLSMSILSAIVIFTSQSIRKTHIAQTSSIYFLDLDKHSRLFCRNGSEIVHFYSDSNEYSLGSYSVEPFLTSLNISKSNGNPLWTFDDSTIASLKFKQKTIRIVNQENVRQFNEDSSFSDVLWVQNMNHLVFDEIVHRTNLVYLDSRLKWDESTKLKQWCFENNLEVRDGYYEMLIN